MLRTADRRNFVRISRRDFPICFFFLFEEFLSFLGRSTFLSQFKTRVKCVCGSLFGIFFLPELLINVSMLWPSSY